MDDTKLERIVDLLERIDESLHDLESPALDHVEAETYTVGDDCVCGVCGESRPYGNTFISTAFTFTETPPEQENDRVCVGCVGRYLDEGEWFDRAEESVTGKLRRARHHLRDANGLYSVQHDELEVFDDGVVDNLGVNDMVDEIGEMIEEHA